LSRTATAVRPTPVVYLRGSIRRLVRNSAFVGVAAHADVSTFAPTSAPGVLDFPVWGSSFITITNSKNTMVKIGAAGSAEHTTFVHLKPRLIGFDGNTNGSDIDGCAKGSFRVGDILVASDLGVSRWRATTGFASTVFGSVWVSTLSAETVGLNVFEGTVH